jgi:imidazolonepropionase-like amidohydrolase
MATGARSVVREDPEPAQLTSDELAAVVDEAHRLGLRVAAHAEGLQGIRLAILAGVDTIEHGLALHREPELLDRMVERGIVLVPTLSTFHDVAERFASDFSPVLVERARHQADEAAETIRAARAAGVTMAMGFDSGPPGANGRELVRMVNAGLSADEAIQAATTGSARALGAENLGVIAPGMIADLLVVDGDPLADIALLADGAGVRLVIHDGVPDRPVDFSPPRG